MSNYLITLKLNYLQSEIDLLKAVDGLTNPLTGDIDGNGHSITNINDILSDGMFETGSIRATTDIQSLTGTISGPIISGNTIEGGDITASGTVSGTVISGASVHGGHITASNTITATGSVTGANVNATTLVSTQNILFQNIPTKKSITLSQSTDPVLYLTNTGDTTRGYLNDNYYNPPLSTGSINDITLVIPSGGLPPRIKQYPLNSGAVSFNVAGQGMFYGQWGATILEIPVAATTYVYNNIILQFNSLTMQMNWFDPTCNALFYISAWFNPSDPQSSPTVIAAYYKHITQGINFITLGSTIFQTAYSDTQFKNNLYLTMVTDSIISQSFDSTLLAFDLKGASYTIQQSPIRPPITANFPPP